MQSTALPGTISTILGPIRTSPLTACHASPGLGPHKPVDAPRQSPPPPSKAKPSAPALGFMLPATQSLPGKLSQNRNYTLGDSLDQRSPTGGPRILVVREV